MNIGKFLSPPSVYFNREISVIYLYIVSLVVILSNWVCDNWIYRFPKKNSRRLWRSQRRKSRSVPEGGADFPAAIFLAGKCPNLGRDRLAFRAAGKSVRSFQAVLKSAGKLSEQRNSDSHSLLEFSALGTKFLHAFFCFGELFSVTIMGNFAA